MDFLDKKHPLAEFLSWTQSSKTSDKLLGISASWLRPFLLGMCSFVVADFLGV